MSQKRMVLPENQFNCKQIQGVLYRNQFLQNKLLVSGKHLHDDKSSKKQFYYKA